MDRAVARANLSRSGDSSDIAPSVQGRRTDNRRPPRRSPTRQPAAWILVLVAIALVPLLVATWTFGRSYRTSEIGQVDSRLTATASGVVSELGAAANRTSRVGSAVAHSPRLQRALVRGATTTRVAHSPNGDVHVQAGPGAQAVRTLCFEHVAVVDDVGSGLTTAFVNGRHSPRGRHVAPYEAEHRFDVEHGVGGVGLEIDVG